MRPNAYKYDHSTDISSFPGSLQGKACRLRSTNRALSLSSHSLLPITEVVILDPISLLYRINYPSCFRLPVKTEILTKTEQASKDSDKTSVKTPSCTMLHRDTLTELSSHRMTLHEPSSSSNPKPTILFVFETERALNSGM